MAGCGADERTKADFIADADTSCAATNAQLRQLGALKPSMFVDSDARHSLERWFSGFVVALEQSVSDLRGLERSEGEDAALARVLFEPRDRVQAH